MHVSPRRARPAPAGDQLAGKETYARGSGPRNTGRPPPSRSNVEVAGRRLRPITSPDGRNVPKGFSAPRPAACQAAVGVTLTVAVPGVGVRGTSRRRDFLANPETR